MDLNLGDSLGRFQIEARIGATGLASLYRARETTTGRRVALKVLRPYLSEASNAAEDYLSITARAAALSHPRVASIVDWGMEDVPWTAFALAEGSVADDSRPRTPREAARIVSDVAEALDAAHAAGLLHLDLKPGNVLIDDDGHFLITDFGMPVVAAGVDPLVRVTSKTPLATFMSPEQADLGATTPASDIYSLGVLAYWLLTGGEAPYEGGDAATVAAKQLRYPAPSLEDAAPGVPPRGRRRGGAGAVSKPGGALPHGGSLRPGHDRSRGRRPRHGGGGECAPPRKTGGDGRRTRTPSAVGPRRTVQGVPGTVVGESGGRAWRRRRDSGR